MFLVDLLYFGYKGRVLFILVVILIVEKAAFFINITFPFALLLQLAVEIGLPFCDGLGGHWRRFAFRSLTSFLFTVLLLFAFFLLLLTFLGLLLSNCILFGLFSIVILLLIERPRELVELFQLGISLLFFLFFSLLF